MKKRFLCILLALCMELMLVPQAAFAETNGDFEYSVTDGKVTITKYLNDYATEVEIPAEIEEKPVTAIGDNAFFFSKYLKSVTIPETVTSIGDNAFTYCQFIKSITIPESVTSIGENAFAYCNGLTSITIPASVESIGVNAFGYCLDLGSIIVAEGNSNYSSVDGVLFNKNKTELIGYPSGNTRTTYTIPAGVESIGKNGLAYGLNLTSITIPDCVTSIGENAFADCYNLTSIAIPAQVESIGDNAFAKCEKLTSISVAKGNPDYASENGVLFKLSNGEKTELIKYPCENKGTSCNIPGSVTSIAGDAFDDCYYLTSITVEDGNPNYSSKDGVLFDKGKTNLIVCPSGFTGISFDIPNGVTSITKRAFSYCEKLERVTIPDSVTLIGSDAFGSCANLKSINLPSGVTTIADSTFSGCGSLKSITIPAGVTTIEDTAFWACRSLESIFLPDKELSIGFLAIPDRASRVKYSLDETNKVTITSATLGDGRTTIEIPSEISGYLVSAMNAFAFAGCANLETIFLPDNGLTIGDSAIPDAASQVKYSPDETNNKAAITSASLGTGRTTIVIHSEISGYPVSAVNASAFAGCTNLETIFLPDNENLSIGDNAFRSTTSKVKYSLDKTNDEITITEIELGTGKSGVAIPETICSYPVVAVANASLLDKISSHTCVGGTETCTTKAVCSLCGKEYGEIPGHWMKRILAKAATYIEAGYKEHWKCRSCGKYFSDADGKNEIADIEAWKAGEGRIDKLIVPVTDKTDTVAPDKDGNKEETLAALADQQLTARSKLVTMKNGKKAVKITWRNEDGKRMDFDGVEIYRSAKRNSGYGKKPFFTTEKDAYYNTAIKKGTKYYYKVRGYVVIDGQKYYTDYSRKAIRTVK